MKLFNSLKCRLYAYIDYRESLILNKQEYYFEANLQKYLYQTTKEHGISNNPIVEGKKVIVSLTTYGKRLYEVYLTIESIMQQTVKPNKIILWIADDMKEIQVPLTLQRQQERGLEIKYCEDIRSYKKLIPTLRDYPEDVIITVDDDVIYQIDMIENLLNSYRKNPKSIIANWALDMGSVKDRMIKPYREWKSVTEEGTSFGYVGIGCAGILYPPHSLDFEVTNREVFMNICKYADDIWFKVMALKNGWPCTVTPQGIHEHTYYDNPLWQDKGLTQVNVNKNMNDMQIKAVFDKYKINSTESLK